MPKKKQKKFDRVVFLGPFKEGLICLNKDDCAPLDTLVIGDGARSLTLEDFSSVRGKVKEDATITIFAHGQVKDGRHILTTGDGTDHLTSEVITILSEAIGYDSKAIIELHSCYGSKSLEEVSIILPKGVTLIGMANAALTDSQYLDSYIKGSKLSSAQTKVNLLLKFPTDFSYVLNGEILRASPPRLLLPPAETKRHLISECKRLDARVKITDKMVAQYNIGLINYHINSKKPPSDALIESIKLSQTNLRIDLDPYSQPPLYQAASFGQLKFVQALIFLGADVNQRSPNKNTPLTVAAGFKHTEVVRELCQTKGVDLDARGESDATSIYLASQDNDLEILQILCDAGANLNKPYIDGSTPLMVATKNGHFEAVDILCKAGANLDAKLPSGETALNIATEDNHLTILQRLCDAGANLNEPPLADGSTPLFTAVYRGHIKAVEILLKARADLNIKVQGFSILDFVIQVNRPEIAGLLLGKVSKSERKKFIAKKDLLSDPMKDVIDKYKEEIRQKKLEIEAKKKVEEEELARKTREQEEVRKKEADDAKEKTKQRTASIAGTKKEAPPQPPKPTGERLAEKSGAKSDPSPKISSTRSARVKPPIIPTAEKISGASEATPKPAADSSSKKSLSLIDKEALRSAVCAVPDNLQLLQLFLGVCGIYHHADVLGQDAKFQPTSFPEVPSRKPRPLSLEEAKASETETRARQMEKLEKSATKSSVKRGGR